MANSDRVIAAVNYVYYNINYIVDVEEFGFPDYWMDPRGTLFRGAGDCEDKSFLVHSLLLAGGIDPLRLRTYFGYLNGVGHAWVAYRRELDNEWIVLDATNNPLTDVDAEPTVAESSNYANAWAYLTDVAYVLIEDYLNSFVASSGEITFPALRMSGVGIHDWIGEVTLTKLGALGFGAFRGSASLPAFTLAASGSWTNKASGLFNAFRLSMIATGKAGVIGSAPASLPLFTIQASGFGSPLGILASSLPKIEVYARGYTEDRFPPGTDYDEGFGILRHSRY